MQKRKGTTDQLKDLFARAQAMSRGKVRGMQTKENEVFEMMITVARLYQDIGALAINGKVAEKRSIEDIFQECLDRYAMADAKYGEFDPGVDQRDLVREAQEELSDTINYLSFMLIKAFAAYMAFEDASDEFSFDELQPVLA